MMEIILSIILLVILVGGAAAAWYGVRRVTVYEFERGLRYVNGRFRDVLQPGNYWYTPLTTKVRKLDARPCFLTVVGQEVLSADGVSLKVSLAAQYQVEDFEVAVHNVQSYAEALYTELQLALREVIGAADIDTVLANRGEISAKMTELVAPKAQAFGLKLLSAGVKDIMFPGQLKELFAQVVNARHEGLAALERARGESAAMRNLANTAKLLESNPHLMQLRLLQAMADSSGHTFVLDVPNSKPTAAIPVENAPVKKKVAVLANPKVKARPKRR